jgi:predicted phosphodiesterase
MTFQVSPLDPYASAIQLWLNEFKTNDEIVALLKAEFGVESSETSVRRAIERHRLDKPVRPASSESDPSERPGVSYNDKNEATVTSGILSEEELSAIQLGDIEVLLTNRGLNPEDWIVERVTVNEWDGNGGRPAPGEDAQIITLRQLKIHLKRRQALDFIMPAVEVKTWPHPSNVYRSDNEEPRLAVILGDEQEPYSDPRLIEKVLAFLDRNYPDILIHLGDLMDFPTISRHKDDPAWAATVQECINAGYSRLYSYRDVLPEAEIVFMVGNHDERIRNELLLRAGRLFGIRPADWTTGEQASEALGIPNLLHLDELGIDFVNPIGGYAHAQYKLSPELAVRHGWLTGEKTARKTLDRLGHSIVVGHTHSQQVTFKTVYGINEEPKIIQAVEAGTLAQVKNGLGYVVNPDWQQGFATAQIWEDGSFSLDLATYNDGVLRWRDQRF